MIVDGQNCFVKGKLLILEDENRVIKRLVNSIAKLKIIKFDVARNLDQYIDLLNKESYDASSLDLKLDRYRLTEKIITTIRDISPQTTRIVYSAHDEEFTKANKAGADTCVLKSNISSDDFIIKLKKGVSTGINRKIYSRLRTHKVDKLPIIPRGISSSEKIENSLKNKAVQSCSKLRKRRNNDYMLEDLLKRKGWWANFNFQTYFKMTLIEKFIYLLRHSEINSDDAIIMLEAKNHTNLDLTSDISEILNKIDKRRLEMLFFIFSHNLKLSSFEINLLPFYLKAKNIYGESKIKPPWDNIGLYNYLLEDYDENLYNAYKWLRNL